MWRVSLKAAGYLCVLALFPAGCVSKEKARLQAKAAYLAGQQQAMERMSQRESRSSSVTFVGPVRTSVIPWSPDLTLAKGLVAAKYYGTSDPAGIVIVREGESIRIGPKQLLDGEDIVLQPQDVVEILGQ